MLPSQDDLTVDEVAQRLRITRFGVCKALREQRLWGYKAGPRAWRIPLAALDEYCREPAAVKVRGPDVRATRAAERAIREATERDRQWLKDNGFL